MTKKTNNQFDQSAPIVRDVTDVRTATWSSVGRDVSECTSAAQVLAESGLDYEVVKMPVQLSDGTVIPNRFATVRPDAVKGVHTFDIVSDKYEIVQNRDAFAFVDYMGDVRFEKAGETASGMTYIIAALPETTVLGDTFVPHVIFRNGFGGNTTIQAAICPLRIVCQNQFAIAFREASNTVRVRHVSNAEAKLEEAREILRANAEYMGLLESRAEQLAKVKVNNNKLESVIESLFPMGEDPENLNSYRRFTIEQSRVAFQNAYNAEDNQNFKGTAWGVVNAYADYITHLTPQGKKDSRFENRMMNTTFKPQVNRVMNVMQALSIAA